MNNFNKMLVEDKELRFMIHLFEDILLLKDIDSKILLKQRLDLQSNYICCFFRIFEAEEMKER
jgi:hypothetical protein